jgi:hypothetical protein
MSNSVSLLPHRSLLTQSYPWEGKISTAWKRKRARDVNTQCNSLRYTHSYRTDH